MAMRNFWIDGSVDGRATDITGGPRAKDGGLSLTIAQRDEGTSLEVVKIYCYYAFHTDELVTIVKDEDGNTVLEKRTKR